MSITSTNQCVGQVRFNGQTQRAFHISTVECTVRIVQLQHGDDKVYSITSATAQISPTRQFFPPKVSPIYTRDARCSSLRLK